MKIIHIVLGKANPERMNGVNIIAHYMAETQKTVLQWQTEIWGVTDTPETITDRAYPVRLFQKMRRSFAISKELSQALDTLNQTVMIHFHGALIPVYYTIAKKLKSRNIRWIITPHSCLLSSSLKRNSFVKNLYLKIFDHFVLQQAHAIHAITEQENHDLRNLGYTNIRIVSNGLPASIYPAILPKMQDDRLVFGYIGRFDIRHKGINNLIEGFFHYKINKLPGELWLIGDGPDRKTLERKVQQLNLTQSVYIQEPAYGDKKADLLKQMDVFTHISHWDAMPTSLIEAAYHAKPMLLSESSGITSQVLNRQAGIITNSHSPIDVYAGLKHFHDRWQASELLDIGQNALEMAKNDFDMQKIAVNCYPELYSAG